MNFKRIFLLILFIFVLSPSAIPNSFALPVSNSAISTQGQKAFDQLSRCLNSKNTLNILYLVDESSSLNDTDPEAKRAEILASSINQLQTFKEGVSINYALATFGDKFQLRRNWVSIDDATVQTEVDWAKNTIPKLADGTATDWELGLEESLNLISEAPGAQDNSACQVLVWLTDGGVNAGDSIKTADSIQKMCGLDPTSGQSIGIGNSLVDEIRQSDVILFGVLLQNGSYLDSLDSTKAEDERFKMSLLLPVVEGAGVLTNGSSFVCGTNPVPDNFAAGALLVAQDPLALAFQFLKVSTLSNGATQGTLSATNPANFLIEPGVARFDIITTSKEWNLTDPLKNVITPSNSQDMGVKIINSGGALKIQVNVNSGGFGQWSFKYATGESAELFLFSGLAMTLDSGELVAGQTGKVSGQIFNSFTKSPADLSVYGNAFLEVIPIDLNGSSFPPQKANIELNSGKFNLDSYSPPEGQSKAIFDVTLKVSTKSGINLSPVTIRKELDVSLPKNFPSLNPKILLLDPLIGKNGKATGVLKVIGPIEGSGKVCFENLTIFSDSNPNRSNNWKIKLNDTDNNSCVEVNTGDSKDVVVEISNSIAANSQVKGEIAAVYTSSIETGKTIKQAISVSFQTKRPIDTAKFIAADFFLIAIGFLLPMLLLYLVSWLTTKFSCGRDLQKATYPVVIYPNQGIKANSSGEPLIVNATDFKSLPNSPDVRKFVHESSVLEAKVSKLPLVAPWFEVIAPDSNRVFTLENLHPPKRLSHKFKTGKSALISGDIGKIWYLTVREQDLKTIPVTESFPAILTVFTRMNISKPNSQKDLIANICTKPGINQALNNLKSNFDKEINDSPKNKKNRNEGTPGGNLQNSYTNSNSDKTQIVDNQKNPSSQIIPPPPPSGSIPPPPPTKGV